MEGQIENIKKEYQRKVEGYFQTLQETVEDSYNNINDAFDDFVNDESNYFKLVSLQLKQHFTKLLPDCLFNYNFQNQLIEGENYLINQNTQQKDQKFPIKKNIQQSPTLPSNNLPCTYYLIQDSIKQDEPCRAIAINQDCSILVAACNSEINVFQFNQGIIKQVQELIKHKDYVSTLNFMKRSNHFISGSYDNQIIIWERNQDNIWICQQMLIGHTSYIACLVLNNNEDIIVSGSNDNTIKFWVRQNVWICSQKIKDHNNCVNGLSLNEKQNKLISCGFDNLILVIKQSEQKNQWQVIQKIKVEQYGYRICFIDNDIFTFQPYEKEQILVFQFINKKFVKKQDIQVKGGYDIQLFPSQYIKQECILINKNASNLSIIRKKLNDKLIIEDSIDFGTYRIFGCISDDGQYLITWDDKSKGYQIRKYKKL